MDSVQGMTQTSAMRQEQTLTPQQLQSLDILCAPVLELQQKINQELAQYSEDLAKRPMIVAANKIDLLPPDSDNLERLRAYVEERGYEFYEISAATTAGTKNLMRTIAVCIQTQNQKCSLYRRPECPFPPAGRTGRSAAASCRSTSGSRSRRS